MRILILDDSEAQAAAVRTQLLSVPAQLWRSGGEEGLEISPDDVEVDVSSARHIQEWRKLNRCTHDVIICDVHMKDGRDEGAIAVFETLVALKSNPAPCLIVMTQFRDHGDKARARIEALANEVGTPIPCILTTKFREMPGVEERPVQLDARDWRNLLVRAIVSRRDHETFERVRRETDDLAKVQALGPFKEPFTRAAEYKSEPLLALVTEPFGLESALVPAIAEDYKWLAHQPHDALMNYLFGDGPFSLASLKPNQAVVVLGADRFLAAALDEAGRDFRSALALPRSRAVVRNGGEQTAEFAGKLVLCVNRQFHQQALGDTGSGAEFYNAIPKITMPTYAEVRGAPGQGSAASMGGLIDYMLWTTRTHVDALDRAIMAAYDWDLGFQGSQQGFEALRRCATWASRRADGEVLPAGLIASELTHTAEQRQSIFEQIEPAALLLYILERLERVFGSRPCLQAAAFLYYKTLSTLACEAVRDETLGALWGEGAIFDRLSQFTEFHLTAARIERAWPAMADLELYAPKSKNHEREAPAVARKMQQMLADDFASALAAPKNSIEERIAAHWKRAAGRGPKGGRRQLGVLEQQFDAA